MKILLVDDDAFLRDMYATKFTESGDEVSVAKDGEEALRLLKESAYDAVLVDMIMPGLHGAELVTAIKASPSGATTKCVVLSNQSEPEDIESTKKAGAAGYIVKADLIPSEVVEKVHTLVS